MTTPRDDIDGLIERLKEPWDLRYSCRITQERVEAAAQLDALSARVKELEFDIAGFRLINVLYKNSTGAAEARALRAEQERDEAYERAAHTAEQFAPPHSVDLGRGHVAWRIAEAIRRLATGNEKEGK